MAEKLSDQQVAECLSELNGWTLTRAGQSNAITKTFDQAGFLAGLGFVTRIAVLAEQADHHPDVLLTYPRVCVTLTTHDAGGVSQKDFSLAAQIDTLT